jgi:vacuolar-type H+-ATPase subunit E/Vma4
MSLQAILDAIRTTGESQLRELEMRTETQMREILAHAGMEAQKIKGDARAKAVAPAGRERARILHRAHLESLHILGSAREELVKATLDQMHGRLANARNEYFYPAVIRKLVEETLAEFDGSDGEEQIQLQADPRDRELLSRVLSDLGLTSPVQYDLDCWGGLIARNEDGKVVVINTLEARFERAVPYMRRFLAAAYENERSEEETGSGIDAERYVMS